MMHSSTPQNSHIISLTQHSNVSAQHFREQTYREFIVDRGDARYVAYEVVDRRVGWKRVDPPPLPRPRISHQVEWGSHLLPLELRERSRSLKRDLVPAPAPEPAKVEHRDMAEENREDLCKLLTVAAAGVFVWVVYRVAVILWDLVQQYWYV
jgi:hypothetical protein